MYKRLGLIALVGGVMTAVVAVFGQGNFLKADVISGDTTVTGNVIVYEDAIIDGDVNVDSNIWGSSSPITSKDSSNFFNCPQGQFVIGVNFTNQRLKCAKL